MSRHIIDMETSWRERLDKLMKDKKLSQKRFADEYTKKYGDGNIKKKTSQGDVCKWLKVGLPYKKPNGDTATYGFPTLKTMRNIADYFEVSISYLIGETSCESFDMEKTVTYTGLSESTIKAIRKITSGKAFFHYRNTPDSNAISALEKILEYPELVSYLKSVCELSEAIKRSEEDVSEDVYNSIPEKYRDDAFLLFVDPEEALNSGIKPTKELWHYADMLEDATIDSNVNYREACRDIKVNRYDLQLKHSKMIDDILKTMDINTGDFL